MCTQSWLFFAFHEVEKRNEKKTLNYKSVILSGTHTQHTADSGVSRTDYLDKVRAEITTSTRGASDVEKKSCDSD